MAASRPPFIECEQSPRRLGCRRYPHRDRALHEKLGFSTVLTWGDPPTFAGVKLDKADMFLRKGTPDPKGASCISTWAMPK